MTRADRVLSTPPLDTPIDTIAVDVAALAEGGAL
jgi:hypothetical protein